MCSLNRSELSQSKKKNVIAVFDFDGTITWCDSLPFFLLKGYGKGFTVFAFLSLIPLFLAFKCHLISRKACKESIIARFFRGVPVEKIQHQAQEFANHFPSFLLRQKALQRIKWHQKQGHLCVLLSANLEIYLNHWAIKQGFVAAFGSILEEKEGVFTGKLRGENCWGIEKVKRLEAWLNQYSDVEVWAYGDSRGDQELLSRADHAFFRYFN